MISQSFTNCPNLSEIKSNKILSFSERMVEIKYYFIFQSELKFQQKCLFFWFGADKMFVFFRQMFVFFTKSLFFSLKSTKIQSFSAKNRPIQPILAYFQAILDLFRTFLSQRAVKSGCMSSESCEKLGISCEIGRYSWDFTHFKWVQVWNGHKIKVILYTHTCVAAIFIIGAQEFKQAWRKKE